MVCTENSFAKLRRIEQKLGAMRAALRPAKYGPGIGGGHGLGALGNNRRGPGCDACGRLRLIDARAIRMTARCTQQGTEQGQRALNAREAWGSHAACACS